MKTLRVKSFFCKNQNKTKFYLQKRFWYFFWQAYGTKQWNPFIIKVKTFNTYLDALSFLKEHSTS